jgi:hypothetical protein
VTILFATCLCKSQLLDLYRVLQKELYSCIQTVTVWRVLRKLLHLKAYKLSIVQHHGWLMVCMPLSLNVFITLATQWNLEYRCKALLETPCVASESRMNCNYPR